MLGPFWRTNQDNPAAGLWRTRVPRNSSTITTASEQCQTPKRAELDRPSSPDLHSGKTRLARPISSHKGVMFGKKPVICYSPCHGLPLDSVALCLHYRRGEAERLHLLREIGRASCRERV